MTVQIALDDVGKTFVHSGPVLEGVTFRAGAGEILALVGKSGSGKSTVLNIIAGLDTPSSGSVARSGELSYVQQAHALMPWRNLFQNVVLPFEIRGRVDSSACSRAGALLEFVGLEAHAHKFPHEMSGGMRQRAALARALAQEAQIMLLDEPFSAIDFDARLRLLRELRLQIKQSGQLAVFVTHNFEEAISVADEVLVLSGAPAKVVYRSKIEVAEDFRDPVLVRKTPDFQRLFGEIWSALR